MNIKSLISLWNHTQQHAGTSGARVCAAVLLGLYNGARFPMDLTDLRELDNALRTHALQVITADATFTKMEVHSWLNHLTGRWDFGQRFEMLAWEYKSFARGRCKKEYQEQCTPTRFEIADYAGKEATSVIVDMDVPRGMGAQRHAAMLARNAGDVPKELFGLPVVESTSVPPGELWVQQAGRVTRVAFDMDAHHRAESTPFFNDLAG